MHRSSVPATRVGLLGLGLALMAPLQPALAFGEDGELPRCATFATCTAAVSSTATAMSQTTFSSIQGNYWLPTSLHAGVNTSSEHDARDSSAPVRVAVGELCANCYTDNPFFSTAVGRSQTDFGINRVAARTSVGAAGIDTQVSVGSAAVRVLTLADVGSAWRDVWRFSADGHFNASVALDGRAGAETVNHFFPPTYQFATQVPAGDWFYDLHVWDVDHMSPDADGFPGPTLVGSVRDRTGNGESRSSFGSTLALDFDFMAGVQYVVISELRANARNGREIDLYNTVKLTDVALSGNAAMSALSGHDYIASPTPAVPEPQTTALLSAGLVLLAFFARRQRGR